MRRRTLGDRPARLADPRVGGVTIVDAIDQASLVERHRRRGGGLERRARGRRDLG
jgi:hypothetical protein